MNVLQYSLLSPVDASMDSRGADFSGVGAWGSDAFEGDGIAGGLLDSFDGLDYNAEGRHHMFL